MDAATLARIRRIIRDDHKHAYGVNEFGTLNCIAQALDEEPPDECPQCGGEKCEAWSTV